MRSILETGLGVAGIAPNVSIMAIKALDQSGEGFLSNIISSVEYAMEMGAQITSNSFGSPNIAASSAFSRVIEAAENSGQLYVAAAGNDGN